MIDYIAHSNTNAYLSIILCHTHTKIESISYYNYIMSSYTINRTIGKYYYRSKPIEYRLTHTYTSIDSQWHA